MILGLWHSYRKNLFGLFCLFIGGLGLISAGYSQEQPEVNSPGRATENASVVGKNKTVKGGEEGWEAPKRKSFSAAERRKECRKYEGQLISYYGRVFKVDSCKRREVIGSKNVSELTRKSRKKIITVSSDTIIMLEEGKAWSLGGASEKRTCKVLEGRYVITGSSDIYFVENCKRRPFPDWETYREHRSKGSRNKSDVLDLSENEFIAIKQGREFDSILDEAYRKLLKQEQEVDTIPLKEACRGLNGKFVTYYSKVYKVEGCKKREVKTAGSIQKHISLLKDIRELSSSQWISLPNGKDLNLK